MRKWLFAVAVLIAGAGGAARAQFYVRPPTNPYFRPQLSPYFTFYYGPGGLGGPYVIPPAVALGGLRSTYPGTVPGGPLVGGPALGWSGISGVPVTSTYAGAGDGTIATDQTGHPTRFMSYSQYFLNQGGATVGTAPAAGLPAQPINATVIGTGSLRTTQSGTRPPRGRENLKP